MAKTIEEISEILGTVRFRRKLFGGVDEQDVWRIVGKLQKEYEELRLIDEAGFQAQIRERDEKIASMGSKCSPGRKTSEDCLKQAECSDSSTGSPQSNGTRQGSQNGQKRRSGSKSRKKSGQRQRSRR